MIKVYLDWNVMAQMKSGTHPVFSQIIKNQDKFLLFYSTSHIGDIFGSVSEDAVQKANIEADLNFITSLTNNLCLHTSKDEIIVDYYEPWELMQQRIDDKDLLSGSILDNLQKILSENEFSKGIGTELIEMIKAIPIGDLLKDKIQDSTQAEQLDEVFPGLSQNPTMEGFFSSFSEMIENLNDKEGYKKLREITQKGFEINQNQITNSRNPFDIINEAHEKSGISLGKYLNNSNSGPKWFNEISNEYLLLDMHGYQQDKVNIKKGRKETFKNTTEDAFHAAFASTCNFYITNDKKSYLKTKQVYNKLNINTVVLKPDEFIEFYNTCLNIDDLLTSLNLIIAIAKSKYYSEKDIENGFIRTYFSPFFFFDYFNKIYLLNDFGDDTLTYTLSKDNPTNGYTYRMEIIKLVTLLNKLLGNDIDNIGEAGYEEFKDEKWIGRKWEFNGISFKLVSLNGYIQLYIDFNI